VNLLRRDDDVQRRCLGQFGPGRIEATFFVASQIHLDDQKDPDLIITSAKRNPCLGGANIDTFWVFYSTPQGYKLGLKVITFSLQVRKTKTKGYRDIDTEKPTGGEVFTTIFKFDGSQYQVWRHWKEPIKM
jgi:hypothetical protein